MTYQEEEQSRLRRQNSREAIALAMKGQWREAIAVNKTIVDLFPNDIEALNRMGRAYMELGEYGEAENAYRRTLQIDSYNAIAQKNIQRIGLLKKTNTSKQPAVQKLEPQVFVEEIGKAGVVSVHALAKPEFLARVVAGAIVNLKVEGNNLTVTTPMGEYLGHVEPKHGQRLVRLMNGGNRYSAAIVSSADKALTVIIREAYQHPTQFGQLSFPTRGIEPAVRTDIGDRVIRREIEQEEAQLGEAGYTVVGGGEETEVLPEESPVDDYEEDSES